MEIQTKLLIRALKAIIKKMEEDGFDSYAVNTDYYCYWIVLTSEWDNLSKEPTLAVGSLEDDWESILKACENEFITYVDYDRIASLLRAVSQAINPPN